MFIRKLLIQLLGFENYLKFISSVFISTFLNKVYLKAHYQVRFLSELVNEGDYCIDIGANLGYFTLPLSQLVGKKGKVFSVEPVELFRNILIENAMKYGRGNIEVIPYALGDEDGKKVKMGTPTVSGVVRHGRTQVLEAESQEKESSFVHEVEMKNPMTLFDDLERLNFVKCDVEGYELHILPHLLPLFEKHHPLLEIEAGPVEHKKQIMEWMEPMGYKVYHMEAGVLKAFDLSMEGVEELYFKKR